MRRYAGNSDINRIYISCFRSVCFISYLSFFGIKIMSTYDEKIFGRNTFVAIKNVIPQVRKNTFVILMISTMMVIVVFGSTLFKTMQK